MKTIYLVILPEGNMALFETEDLAIRSVNLTYSRLPKDLREEKISKVQYIKQILHTEVDHL